jgi:hypothetical protein
MVAGDLRNTLVLITRNGKAGDMQTTYSMDILPNDHPVFKPEMIPADFSAFNNFNIARHSYWEKTADEIQVYLTTGQFPEVIKNNTNQAAAANNVAAVAPSYAGATVNAAPAPVAAPVYEQPAAPTYVAPTVAPAPTPAPATTAAPAGATRNFSGFSF